jgi:hypothetical protein
MPCSIVWLRSIRTPPVATAAVAASRVRRLWRSRRICLWWIRTSPTIVVCDVGAVDVEPEPWPCRPPPFEKSISKSNWTRCSSGSMWLSLPVSGLRQLPHSGSEDGDRVGDRLRVGALVRRMADPAGEAADEEHPGRHAARASTAASCPAPVGSRNAGRPRRRTADSSAPWIGGASATGSLYQARSTDARVPSSN